jgi:hypothetical protein
LLFAFLASYSLSIVIACRGPSIRLTVVSLHRPVLAGFKQRVNYPLVRYDAFERNLTFMVTILGTNSRSRAPSSRSPPILYRLPSAARACNSSSAGHNCGGSPSIRRLRSELKKTAVRQFWPDYRRSAFAGPKALYRLRMNVMGLAGIGLRTGARLFKPFWFSVAEEPLETGRI